jgi:DNA (cytosine-5)-methyltransferase 1
MYDYWNKRLMSEFEVLDFFAGSGLVSKGLSSHFDTVWANDVCPKKAKVFQANFPKKNFVLEDIKNVSGEDLPSAFASWASFPCVDLSLAGSRLGIHAERSGLFFEWLRITEEMKRIPPILIIENVEGLVTSKSGAYYKVLHECLTDLGYKAGPLIIDAKHWVPQSRVRSFVIAVNKNIDTSDFEAPVGSLSHFHTRSLLKATDGLKDLVWWNLPEPGNLNFYLKDIIDLNAPVFPKEKNDYVLSLIPENHFKKLMSSKEDVVVAPGYRRTRNGKQVLELRFDGLAGCLRVPRGGSSRQYVVIREGKKLKSRLLTVDEAACLMGAPKGFKLPGSYNEGYGAMGDAVAYPVVKFLSKNLLFPLAKEIELQDPLYVRELSKIRSSELSLN